MWTVAQGPRGGSHFVNDDGAGLTSPAAWHVCHPATEGVIGQKSKTTFAKREREKARQIKQREKEARRVERKAIKLDRYPTSDGEDPDLAGLRWGPQDPLY